MRQDLSVGHSVFPGYARDTANTSQVEGVESSLLSGIRSPCRAAVQLCADDTGVVGCHFCFHCQVGVYPHTSREACESYSRLLDPRVDLCVQRQVVGDGGAAVRQLMDGVKFVVVVGNDWRWL